MYFLHICTRSVLDNSAAQAAWKVHKYITIVVRFRPLITHLFYSFTINQGELYKDVDYLGWASANYAEHLKSRPQITSCYFCTETEEDIYVHEVNWFALHTLRNRMEPVKNENGELTGVKYNTVP